MSFNQAIIDAQAETAAKSGRELAASLRKHGVPEPRDLGALQSLRARFGDLSGGDFERILQAVRDRTSKV